MWENGCILIKIVSACKLWLNIMSPDRTVTFKRLGATSFDLKVSQPLGISDNDFVVSASTEVPNDLLKRLVVVFIRGWPNVYEFFVGHPLYIGQTCVPLRPMFK